MSGACSPTFQAVSLLFLLAACGGGSAEAPPGTAADHAADVSSSGGGQKSPADGALNLKLRPPDPKVLDLAAKGWGAELGRVLGAAETLGSLEKLDASDNDLGA